MIRENRKPVLFFFLLLFCIILYLFYRLFAPFLQTLILALILTGLFFPVYQRLEVLLKGRRMPASLITCLLVFLTVFLPLIYIIATLANETYALYIVLSGKLGEGQFQLYLDSHRPLWDDAMTRLDQMNLPLRSEDLELNLLEIGKQSIFFVYQQARALLSNLTKFFFHFLFLLLLLFYLFLDGARLRSFLFSLSPLPEEQERFLAGRFNEMARAILLINGLLALLQGVVGGLAFWLFGIPSPFLWASLMVIMAFLPLVGISFVYIPAALYLLFLKQYVTAVFFLLFFFLLSFIAEYLMKPRMVGQQSKIHALMVLLSILGGLWTFGVLGILYGPLILTAFLALAELYRQTYEEAVLGKRLEVDDGEGTDTMPLEGR